VITTSLTWTPNALILFGALCLIVRDSKAVAYGFAAIGGWAGLLGGALERLPSVAALFGLFAVYATWLWWRNARRGRWKRGHGTEKAAS